MNNKFIPYGNQWIDKSDILAITKVLKSNFLTTGPKIEQFEKKLAKYVGAKYAVVVSNGTAALHAACFAAGIKRGNEVITSPITFVATANAILYCGAKPVFADINPKTYNIESEDIKRKITNKTKAIIPVHYTGQPCDMDKIMKIADEYNLIIIEDGAHALGAVYNGKMIGSIGDMTTFSFHPVKPITTGEGGAVTTNDKDLYDKLKLFKSHGITKDFGYNEEDDIEPWYYEQRCLGYNYRMTDIQAALGLSQLNKLDMFLKRRREIADRYNRAFKEIEQLQIPYQMEGAVSGWHIYVLKLNLNKLNLSRKEIFYKLLNKGIDVNVHYIPVYYHPYYKKLGYKKGLCKNAEMLYERLITIPLYPKMTDEDIEYVIVTIKDIILKYKY